jgi:hypothetical protein
MRSPVQHCAPLDEVKRLCLLTYMAAAVPASADRVQKQIPDLSNQRDSTRNVELRRYEAAATVKLKPSCWASTCPRLLLCHTLHVESNVF